MIPLYDGASFSPLFDISCIEATLSETLYLAGKSQLQLAESEKSIHIGQLFRGRRVETFF